MDKQLKYEIALYIFPFFSNTFYRNKDYLTSLFKKYGKKKVYQALKEEGRNGKMSDAFK